MSDPVRPHRRQPTRLPHPWDSSGKNTEVGCHFLLNAWKWKVKVKSLGYVQLLATPWTAAYQAPPSMGFFQARVLEWVAISFSKYLWDDIKEIYIEQKQIWKKVKYLLMEKIKFFSKLGHNRNNKEFQEFCKRIEMQKSR